MESFRHTPLAPDARPAVSIHSDDMLEISLCGQIGADKPISLESVRLCLAARCFRHLHIVITTTGGIVDEAFRIYDFIRSQPASVSAQANGLCLSAGMVILMAGDLRSASTGTELLLHPAGIQRDDVLPDRLTWKILQAQADNLAAIDRRVVELFANRTGWPAEWFAKEIETEDLLSEADAIETGLIHEFEGMTVAVDSEWPARHKQMSAAEICFPRYMRTSNYFAACRASRRLRA